MEAGELAGVDVLAFGGELGGQGEDEVGEVGGFGGGEGRFCGLADGRVWGLAGEERGGQVGGRHGCVGLGCGRGQ